jgi:hypothetical protein
MVDYRFGCSVLVRTSSAGSSTAAAILDVRSQWATGNNKNNFKIIL